MLFYGVVVPLTGRALLPGLGAGPKRREVNKTISRRSDDQKKRLSKNRGLCRKISGWILRVGKHDQYGRSDYEAEKGAKTTNLVSEETRRGPVQKLENGYVWVRQKDIRRSHREQARASNNPETKTSGSGGDGGVCSEEYSASTKDGEEQSKRNPLREGSGWKRRGGRVRHGRRLLAGPSVSVE